MEGVDGQPEGRFSLADANVARAVRDWLGVVAKHVDYDVCVAAAAESLSAGLPLASFGCTKCGAVHLDSAEFARKAHVRHVCLVCGHRWVKSPSVIGNPLAALGCWLEGATVHVGKVPVTAGAVQ